MLARQWLHISQAILAYLTDKFAAIFDAGVAWLEKLVLPGLSTIVDEITAAGFFYAEPIGSAIMSAIGQLWNVVKTAAHGLGSMIVGGIGDAIKWVIHKVFEIVKKIVSKIVTAVQSAVKKAKSSMASLLPKWVMDALKKVFNMLLKGHNYIGHNHIGHNHIGVQDAAEGVHRQDGRVPRTAERVQCRYEDNASRWTFGRTGLYMP